MDIRVILKKIEPFIAISIFIMLLILSIGLYNHVSLQKEIKDNCGYTTNSYYCVCYDSDNPELELENSNKINISFEENSKWDLENS